MDSLDPSTEDDLALAREAMKRWPKRWRGIDAKAKDTFAAGLVEAADKMRDNLKQAESTGEAAQAAGVIASIVRTAVMMEDQVQKDEHLEDKNERIDAGKATDLMGVTRVEIAVPPLPELPAGE